MNPTNGPFTTVSDAIRLCDDENEFKTQVVKLVALAVHNLNDSESDELLKLYNSKLEHNGWLTRR